MSRLPVYNDVLQKIHRDVFYESLETFEVYQSNATSQNKSRIQY